MTGLESGYPNSDARLKWAFKYLSTINTQGLLYRFETLSMVAAAKTPRKTKDDKIQYEGGSRDFWLVDFGTDLLSHIQTTVRTFLRFCYL